jgi:hypothetical protein
MAGRLLRDIANGRIQIPPLHNEQGEPLEDDDEI